jgi:Xaa-Pro aminopeptidase
MHTQNSSQVAERLALIRAAMRQQQIDALMVPSADPHLSEYLPARWQGREWLSGFTGSVGTLIITQEFAGVWTDARYWTQAEQQLAGTGIQLMKLTSGASVQYVDWLAGHLKAGQTVAVDGAVLGLAIARLLEAGACRAGVTLRTDPMCCKQVWPERPPLPAAPCTSICRRTRRKVRIGKLADCAPHAAAGRQPPPDFHARRYRLPVQPARRRRQLYNPSSSRTR